MKDTNSAPISEVFAAYEGEGYYIGSPVTFVRLGRCNLDCSWCDSVYSWQPQYEHFWKDWTVEKLVECIERKKNRLVCFTGGEPLLHQMFIINTIKRLLKKSSYEFLIETNGTILPKEMLSDNEASGLIKQTTHIICSPKLFRMVFPVGEHDIKICKQMIEYARHLEFKFVVGDNYTKKGMQDDIQIVKQFLKKIYEGYTKTLNISIQPVFPGGTFQRKQISVQEQLQIFSTQYKLMCEHSKDLVEYCHKMNWRIRLLCQLHKLAFFDERGR